MLNIAVLGSTQGADLQALLDAKVNIVVVLSNKPLAGILDKARQAGVEALSFEDNFEEQALVVLKRRQVDLILLIGFMKILSPNFIKQFEHKILNIHPSLLPKYAGGMNMNIHAEVLKNKDAVTGCTLHYVTTEVDAGPIYGQEAVPVLPDDTPETLKARVQQAEQKLLLRAINELSILLV
ncbi:MAG: phosphoribosylglycinamide formyltransferase [Patescibacteria group bacterium]|jgi:formyltetrahydrofolate-dependent phosphoribosylglycinamide formyltransferase